MPVLGKKKSFGGGNHLTLFSRNLRKQFSTVIIKTTKPEHETLVVRLYVSNLIKEILKVYGNSNFVFSFFFFFDLLIPYIHTPIPHILTQIPCIPTPISRIPFILLPDYFYR